MKIRKPTIAVLAVTAISLAILFFDIIDNPANSNVKVYFESSSLMLQPINATNLPALEEVQLQTPQDLIAKAQTLNTSNIYTDGTAPTTVYTYGIIDINSEIAYYYSSVSWFGQAINPMIVLAAALLIIIFTAALCARYGE